MASRYLPQPRADEHPQVFVERTLATARHVHRAAHGEWRSYDRHDSKKEKHPKLKKPLEILAGPREEEHEDAEQDLRRHDLALDQFWKKDGFEDKEGVQFAVVTNKFHTGPHDPNERMNVIFFEIRGGQVWVQRWRDKKTAHKKKPLFSLYDKLEQYQTSKRDWQPYSLVDIGAVRNKMPVPDGMKAGDWYFTANDVFSYRQIENNFRRVTHDEVQEQTFRDLVESSRAFFQDNERVMAASFGPPAHSRVLETLHHPQ
ncbi:hypothetical protein JCM10207_003198 [Rhodosporidiobolus poonsookiae]